MLARRHWSTENALGDALEHAPKLWGGEAVPGAHRDARCELCVAAASPGFPAGTAVV